MAPRNGFHLEPRCRVCRNDQVRKKVNDLLATGASYAMVVRALAADNAELDKCDRVTIDSVRNHCGRHFPVQNVAKATYREILERRAKANGVDFVEGVATAITPIAFFETVMVKSYETLVDSDTKVDVNTGIVAAGRLQSLIDSRDYDHELLVMKVQMAAICDSGQVHSAAGDVGGDRREAGGAGAASGGARRRQDSFDDADDDPYDPTEFIDDGRRVLTSAAPAVTEGDGDRCRCGRNCSAASVVQPETVWRIASRWQRRRTPPGCAHALIAIDRRSRAAIALAAYPHPTGQAVISLYGEHSGPFGRPECESWADRPLFAGDRALRRSAIAHRSRGSGGVTKTRERRPPHRHDQSVASIGQRRFSLGVCGPPVGSNRSSEEF